MMDNMVACFEPRAPPRAGEHREIAYTLSWKMQDEEALSPERAIATRIGEIGPSPVTRRFVIEFEAPRLRELASNSPVVAEITPGGNGYVTRKPVFQECRQRRVAGSICARHRG